MARTTHQRNLLKFSHYSTAVVLPKDLLDQFGWQPGDRIDIWADNHINQLILCKTNGTSPIQAQGKLASKSTVEEPESQPPIVKSFPSEVILPIPEIDD